VKQLKKRLTYANVMSSIAVFLVLGGATAIAAGLAKNSVGTKQLKNNAVTTAKIKNDAVTGAKVNESTLGTVPSASSATNAANAAFANKANTADKAATADNANNAANAAKLNGLTSASFVGRSDLLWAIVDENGTLVNGFGATGASRLASGEFRIVFNREVTNCASGGTATDISGGAAPVGSSARFLGTDNRVQAADNTVDVSLTNASGENVDPAGGDGFMVTLFC
jgi:hypothetical protein